MKRLCWIAAGAWILASAAWAGEATWTDRDGEPVLWPGEQPVSYFTDRSGLGVLSEAEARLLIARLMEPWQAVADSSFRFEHRGTLDQDVDESNFGLFLGAAGGQSAPRGQNVVAFDADGQIFDTLFGQGTGIVGFVATTFVDDGSGAVPPSAEIAEGSQIVEATVFLNGRFIDGVHAPAEGNFEIPFPAFEAAIVHEIGHFAGLGHTQIHGLGFAPESDLPGLTTPVETMFPFIQSNGDQRTLERDDQVTLARLYPSPAFEATQACVAGRVVDLDGSSVAGINVVARAVGDGSDALSGVTRGGGYRLCGLRPATEYRLRVEEIDAFHTRGSRVGPFSPPRVLPGPAEYWSGEQEGHREASDLAASFVLSAGELRSGLDIYLEAQSFEVLNQPLPGQIGPLDLVIEDFDGDSRRDLVGARSGALGGEPGNDLVFYRGLGSGLFAAPRRLDQVPGISQVERLQLNPEEDPFPDLAVASDGLTQVLGYLGDGQGGFSAPRVLFQAPLGAGENLVSLAAGRFDDDPRDDLLFLVQRLDEFGRAVDATAYSLLGDGRGSVSVVTSPLPFGWTLQPQRHRRLVFGAFAGDAALDAAFVARSSPTLDRPPALWLLVGDGDGGFAPREVSFEDYSFSLGQGLAAADFDGDGAGDLAVVNLSPVDGSPNYTRSWIELMRGDGQGDFQPVSRYWVPESLQDALVSADFDGDGDADLASAGPFFGRGRPGARLTIAYGDGQGGIRSREVISGLAEFPGATPASLAVTELDGDGALDLVVSSAALVGLSDDFVPHLSVLMRRPTGCLPSARHLCLAGGRFRAEVVWRDHAGRSGSGRAMAMTHNTGAFWFFDAANPELMVKVLDGAEANQRFWVFFGSLTDVAFSLVVTDLETGEVRRYDNPRGRLQGRGDAAAFRASGTFPPPAPAEAGPGPRPELSLLGGRFEVTAEFDLPGEGLRRASASPLTDQAGTFWVFDDSNLELMVKLLDGRPVNGHFWFFYGSLSGLDFNLRVRDTLTGEVRLYESRAGQLVSRGDTVAF